MFVKLFGAILDSSIWATSLETRVLWISMLALADEHGIVHASVRGLAHRARLSEEACIQALAELEAPDADSRTPDYEGRRIERVAGGWLVLNYAKYREIRSRSQLANAARQKRHRERVEQSRGSVTRNAHNGVVTGVTTTASPSSSAFGSGPYKEEQIVVGDKSARMSDSADALLSVLESVNLHPPDFGEDWPSVARLIGSARFPESVAATISSHLRGVDGPAYTGVVVGRAAREFAASGEQFNAQRFSRFVRNVAQAVTVDDNRRRGRNERRYIDAETEQREQERREIAATNELLLDFARTRPECFARLKEQAEGSVEARSKGRVRDELVKVALVKLVIDETTMRSG